MHGFFKRAISGLGVPHHHAHHVQNVAALGINQSWRVMSPDRLLLNR